jgi:hypothetical protein
VKEAGPKNFVMSLVAEIPNLCCERARPNVSYGEPNPGADNGFVTMFFLLIPALTALISLALSWWISDLHFASELDVLCWFGCRLGVAPVFLAEILGTAGSAMITIGCRFG